MDLQDRRIMSPFVIKVPMPQDKEVYKKPSPHLFISSCVLLS
jgi:hypothetical protein